MLDTIVAHPTHPTHAEVLERISARGRDDLVTFTLPTDRRARRAAGSVMLFGRSGPRSHPDRRVVDVAAGVVEAEFRVGDIRAWYAQRPMLARACDGPPLFATVPRDFDAIDPRETIHAGMKVR